MWLKNCVFNLSSVLKANLLFFSSNYLLLLFLSLLKKKFNELQELSLESRGYLSCLRWRYYFCSHVHPLNKECKSFILTHTLTIEYVTYILCSEDTMLEYIIKLCLLKRYIFSCACAKYTFMYVHTYVCVYVRECASVGVCVCVHVQEQVRYRRCIEFLKGFSLGGLTR